MLNATVYLRHYVNNDACFHGVDASRYLHEFEALCFSDARHLNIFDSHLLYRLATQLVTVNGLWP